jgi:hypothetical protein
MVQGELFRDESSISISGFDRSKKSFLLRHQVTLTLDKLLLIFISQVIIFALTYSFGVEHGKKMMEKNLESLLPAHSDVVSLSRETPVPSTENGETIINFKQEPANEAETAPVQSSDQETAVPKSAFPVVDLTKKGTYTIQLVTYADEKQAIQEITRLKSKGHDSFVILSGHYYQVCANYFENQAKARSFLKQFNELSRYPDAYVRPAVR